jgi:adhesin transport system outer membrane protein
MTKKLLLISTLLTSIFAEQPYSIVNSAIEAHPDVNRQIKFYNGVLQDLEIAKSDNLPTLDYIGELGRERSSSDNTNTTDLNYYKNNLTLKQNLFRGYKTQSEIKQNEARISSAAYTVLDKANTVALDTISAYIEVLKEHYLTELFKENVQNHEDILAKIKEKNDAGIGKKSEVLQTQSRLKLAYSNLLVQQNNFVDTLTQYHFIVGRHFNQNEYIEPNINYKLPENINKVAYIALINNPSIKALKSNIIAKKAEYKKAKSDFYPILDAIASQDWNNNADGIEGDDESTSIALVARWNLYRGGADEAARLKALEAMNEERNNLRRIQRDVIKQARLAYMAYKSYTLQIEYLKEHVNKAKLTLNAYEEEYGLGRRDLLAILDAQKEYNSAQQTLITAKYDLLKSKYKIAGATNELIYIIKSNIPSKLLLTSIEDDLNNDKNFAKNVLCDNPLDRNGLDKYDCKYTNPILGYESKVENKVIRESYIQEKSPVLKTSVAKPKFIKLSKVYFDKNKYNITLKAENILKENIKKLNEKKNYKLQILGYTDSSGSKKINELLSKKRAISTKLKLIELGAKLKQIEIIPMGASNPVASNDTKQNRALNRRVELKIIEL